MGSGFLIIEQQHQRLAGLGLGVIALAGLGIAVAVSDHAGDRSSLSASLPAPVNDRIWASPTAAGRPIVVIDAGHGGSDPGATGISGTVKEKQLTLAFAQELRDLLVERGRVRVAMTRDDDSYPALDARAAVAERLDAALFISLHMDSAANAEARGASVYSLSDVASDAEAARVAAAANRGADDAGDGNGGVQAVLADLAARSRMGASADLASRLVSRAGGRFELRPQPHKFAAFHVLRRSGAPAILFEAGYLSNAADEAQLRDPQYRRKLALALAEAIESEIASQAVR
ncbi:MAG: N-acetylmuramoyl-L-alanine amidase [Sphingomicrobium sp.]